MFADVGSPANINNPSVPCWSGDPQRQQIILLLMIEMVAIETPVEGSGFHIRIGKKEHIEDLLFNGKLYCNHISEFAKNTEFQEGQSDRYETAVEIKEVKQTKLWLRPHGKPDIPFKYLNIKTAKFLKCIEDAKSNIFCLYTHHVTADYLPGTPFQFSLPKELKGDSCLFIMNHHEFVKRVTLQLREQSISFESRFVRYTSFDKEHVMKTFFDKELKYQDQNEYRFLIEGTHSGPFIFSIGSIEDIAFMMPYKEVENKWFVFELVDEKNNLYELKRLDEN